MFLDFRDNGDAIIAFYADKTEFFDELVEDSDCRSTSLRHTITKPGSDSIFSLCECTILSGTFPNTLCDSLFRLKILLNVIIVFYRWSVDKNYCSRARMSCDRLWWYKAIFLTYMFPSHASVGDHRSWLFENNILSIQIFYSLWPSFATSRGFCTTFIFSASSPSGRLGLFDTLACVATWLEICFFVIPWSDWTRLRKDRNYYVSEQNHSPVRKQQY